MFKKNSEEEKRQEFIDSLVKAMSANLCNSPAYVYARAEQFWDDRQSRILQRKQQILDIEQMRKL